MPPAPPYYTEDGADLNFAKQGGNTLGAPLVIGTTDAFGVDIEANGLKVVKIASGAPADSLVINVTGIGIGELDPQNKLDISGAQVIGSGFAGVETAPTDGLLVEGNMGVGIVLPLGVFHANGGNIFVGDETNTARSLQFRRNAATIGGMNSNSGIFNLFGGTTAALHLTIRDTGNVGIGQASPAGRFHSKVADAEALPVVVLEQLDLSEEMFEFITTIGAGNPVEAVGATTFTPTHYIKVLLPGGLVRFQEVGTFV